MIRKGDLRCTGMVVACVSVSFADNDKYLEKEYFQNFEFQLCTSLILTFAPVFDGFHHNEPLFLNLHTN